jgi:hypothetical protein
MRRKALRGVGKEGGIKHARKDLGAFSGPGPENRAIRCNLFYRGAVKKDFRFYPLRMGEQRRPFSVVRVNMKKRIILFGTQHNENGKCNPEELCKIIEKIKPDIIFEEIPEEYFNFVYAKPENVISEIRAIKKYLTINKDIRHIPVDNYSGPLFQDKETDDLIEKLDTPNNNNKEISNLMQRQLEEISRKGFPLLNTKKNDKLNERIIKMVYRYLDDFGTQHEKDLYDKYHNYHSLREDEILRNVIHSRYRFENGLLLIGALHRRTIIKKLKLPQNATPDIEWILYYRELKRML